jgi:hypothetical protein
MRQPVAVTVDVFHKCSHAYRELLTIGRGNKKWVLGYDRCIQGVNNWKKVGGILKCKGIFIQATNGENETMKKKNRVGAGDWQREQKVKCKGKRQMEKKG